MNSGKNLSQASLTVAELERLETLLWERAAPNGGMPMEMLDGFFSALVTGPELVMPSEYNRLIWGDPPPVWESVQEASESFYLIQGFWNHIVARVALDPEDHAEEVAPAIMMPDALLAVFDQLVEKGQVPEALDDAARQFPLASGWALGFFLGVEMRETAWDDWAAEYDHIDEHLGDIQRLMELPAGFTDDEDEDEDGDALSAEGDEGLEDVAVDEEEDDDSDAADDDEPSNPPDLIERLDIMFELPHMLHAFHVLRVTEQARAQGPAKRGNTPGRNDPCPCGSGRKFKKCHGDPQRLH